MSVIRSWRSAARGFGAGALAVGAHWAASGLALACYARGRAVSPIQSGGHQLTPLAWAEGQWSTHLSAFGLTLAWLALFIAFVLWSRRDRLAWLWIGLPALAFAWSALQTLQMAYACNIF